MPTHIGLFEKDKHREKVCLNSFYPNNSYIQESRDISPVFKKRSRVNKELQFKKAVVEFLNTNHQGVSTNVFNIWELTVYLSQNKKGFSEVSRHNMIIIYIFLFVGGSGIHDRKNEFRFYESGR